MSKLQDILRKYSAINTTYGTDKVTSHSYGQVYEHIFEKVKDAKRVLEIGFDGGASLQAYSEYFKDATIYGIDIEDRRLEIVKQNPRIQTYIGDATLESTIKHFSGTFDLIIEDASHSLEHQVRHFQDFSPYTKPGGFYIIEDIAETNKDSLANLLFPYAQERNFDWQIFDLRREKGRFDDILFVFHKLD